MLFRSVKSYLPIDGVSVLLIWKARRLDKHLCKAHVGATNWLEYNVRICTRLQSETNSNLTLFFHVRIHKPQISFQVSDWRRCATYIRRLRIERSPQNQLVECRSDHCRQGGGLSHSRLIWLFDMNNCQFFVISPWIYRSNWYVILGRSGKEI